MEGVLVHPATGLPIQYTIFIEKIWAPIPEQTIQNSDQSLICVLYCLPIVFKSKQDLSKLKYFESLNRNDTDIQVVQSDLSNLVIQLTRKLVTYS